MRYFCLFSELFLFSELCDLHCVDGNRISGLQEGEMKRYSNNFKWNSLEKLSIDNYSLLF